MMGVDVTAPLIRHPDAAAHRRAEHQRSSGSQRDATDQARKPDRPTARRRAGGAHHEMLQRAGDIRSVAHSDVEPDDRRARRPEQRRGGGLASRRHTADRIHPGGQGTSGQRLQHPVGSAIANVDALDIDRERRRVRQYQLIDDVKAPVGTPHGARARQHPRRYPGELLAGHTAAGVSRSPRLRRGRYPGHHEKRCDENRDPPPAMPRPTGDAPRSPARLCSGSHDYPPLGWASPPAAVTGSVDWEVVSRSPGQTAVGLRGRFVVARWRAGSDTR